MNTLGYWYYDEDAEGNSVTPYWLIRERIDGQWIPFLQVFDFRDFIEICTNSRDSGIPLINCRNSVHLNKV